MLRYSTRILNTNTARLCSRQGLRYPPSAKQYSMMASKLPTKDTMIKPLKQPLAQNIPKPSKILAVAATTTTFTTPFLFKKPVHCEAVFAHPTTRATAPIDDDIAIKKHQPILRRGELTFGTFLGLCTGYLIKKVGKIFAAFVGTGFIFLQYLSQKGYITVHWDRIEGRYNNTLDLDKDGRVTKRDLHSKWQGFVNFLTNNIQFKSTFLIGFYAGIRYG